MEADLYDSDEWKKATPKQRQEFISWVRVNQAAAKREAIAKAKAERRNEAAAKVQPIASRTTKAKKKAAAQLKKQKTHVHHPIKVKRKVFVAGVDVKTDAFLSTYEWRKLRMMALKKYGPRCQCCGATPANGAVMNVDHIKPRKLFPDLALDINNLQILCHDCNHGKGNWDETDWRNPA
jgi:hypothetical protein